MRLPRRAAHQESLGADYVAVPGASALGSALSARGPTTASSSAAMGSSTCVRPGGRAPNGRSKRASPMRSIAPSSRCATTAAWAPGLARRSLRVGRALSPPQPRRDSPRGKRERRHASDDSRLMNSLRAIALAVAAALLACIVGVLAGSSGFGLASPTS